MRTRSKPSKASKTKSTSNDDIAEPTSVPLPIADRNPPQIFILPKSLSKNARIITLAHPRTQAPTRYYHCPETGIYEIKRTVAPVSAYRSLLITPDLNSDPTVREKDDENVRESPFKGGYVCKTFSFFAITPIDPLFLILPVVSPRPGVQASKSEKILFMSADDLLEKFFEHSRHLQYVTEHESTRRMLEMRLAAVCDSVEAGDETMYRLNQLKLLKELLSKARRMTDGGLPPSMEDQLIKKALDVPMVSLLGEEEPCKLKKEESTADSISQEPSIIESNDSQSMATNESATGSQSTVSTTSTTFTVPTPPGCQNSGTASTLEPTEEITNLLRLRTALSFVFSSYVPKHLVTSLESLLESSASEFVDFKPLTAHLEALSELRAKLMARTARQGPGGRKRHAYEDDEDACERAEKRQKKEDEEKKKKVGESRALRDLKKVDTKGMKKMSDFFKKK